MFGKTFAQVLMGLCFRFFSWGSSSTMVLYVDTDLHTRIMRKVILKSQRNPAWISINEVSSDTRAALETLFTCLFHTSFDHLVEASVNVGQHASTVACTPCLAETVLLKYRCTKVIFSHHLKGMIDYFQITFFRFWQLI